ncbi:Crp/Fnr family transcriptional regulator [Siculibacillus lacustris]|uniref:Crp/Fnr family transcriptional regulator n=1 Tax=Siculibacillus lacustris TaxID=1549641 RepID=A0A4Q9VVS4_9HYPH|nr:Crp/Fnr family transcriptional regulator [Siculibacillus lacustris]TBW40376.1 Crp/Fnr family transcriptional regulator [Siculibacillus lacustris]
MTDSGRQIACPACPLRKRAIFIEAVGAELDFVSSFKMGELHARPGGAIYLEGATSPHLFTVLSGWAFRYKSLPDGRRQILNYVLPGDFIGLQATLAQALEHGIEALTDVRLCVFSRDRLDELFRNHPPLARNLTWLAAREERLLDDQLLAVGRRHARERVAFLLWHLWRRARESGVLEGGALTLPMTQQHLADTLGMSLVTFNKTLQRLRTTGVFTLADRRLEIHDEGAMATLAAADARPPERRPLI